MDEFDKEEGFRGRLVLIPESASEHHVRCLRKAILAFS